MAPCVYVGVGVGEIVGCIYLVQVQKWSIQ